MIAESTFEEAMARLRAGDEAVAEDFFKQYAGRLIALARGQIDRRLQGKVDPEDILQSVFKSFFVRQADGRLVPSNWDHVWALLVTITDRKCGKKRDYFRAACRDFKREVADRSDGEVSLIDNLTQRCEPTPEEAAMLSEEVGRFLSGFDERDRQIVLLQLQNYSVPEIRIETGRSQRTIFRVLKVSKKRLERLVEGPAD